MVWLLLLLLSASVIGNKVNAWGSTELESRLGKTHLLVYFFVQGQDSNHLDIILNQLAEVYVKEKISFSRFNAEYISDLLYT